MAQTALEPITSERRCLIVSTPEQLDNLREQLSTKGYPQQKFEPHGSFFYTVISEELHPTERDYLAKYCTAVLPG